MKTNTITYMPPTQRIARVHTFTKELLETRLPDDLRYHVPSHTFDPALGVVAMANHYATLEALPIDRRELVLAAAYFHDTGYIVSKNSNEPIGSAIAETYLPGLGFSEEEVNKIGILILDTNPTREPRTLLGGLLADADTDNLGREDFLEKAELLGKEIGIPKGGTLDWYKSCLMFIQNHKFHTNAARELRDKQKAENIRKLERLIGFCEGKEVRLH